MSKVYGYIRSRTYKESNIKECPYYIEIEGILRQMGSQNRLYYDGYKTMTENRLGLVKLIKKMEPNSVLIVHSLDRLVKGYHEAIQFILLTLEKNITISFLTGDVKQIDRESANKYTMMDFMKMFEECFKSWNKDKSLMERLQFNVRCSFGRRPTRMSRVKLRAIQKDIMEYKVPITELVKKYNMTSATIYKYISPTGEIRPHGEQILAVDSYLDTKYRHKTFTKQKTTPKKEG